MNDKLDEFNRGIFRFTLPELIVSEENIDVCIGVGSNYEGSLIITNKDGTVFKGVAYSDHELVRIKNHSFSGVQNEIKYEYIGKETVPNESISGKIKLVTDCGEIEIPFRFLTLQVAFESSLGMVGDLKSFCELAKHDGQEAVRIFNSPQFERVMLHKDGKNELLYRSLMRSHSKNIAMEEFLCAIRKKEPILYGVSENEKTYVVGPNPIVSEFKITKSTWGYCEISIRQDKELLKLSKENLTMADFEDGTCTIGYEVRMDQLVPGDNITTILVDCIVETFEIKISCYVNKGISMESEEHNLKKFRAMFIQNYLDFRCGKIDLDRYIADGERIVQNLCMILDNGLNKLFKIHLLITSGHMDRASHLLNEVEVYLDAKEKVEPLERCGYMYLKTLINEDEEFVKIAIRAILNYYNHEFRDWKILWILLYINKKYDGNHLLKLGDIKEQFDSGCYSPVMYFEANTLYNNEYTLVRGIGRFETQVIYWGAKNHCVSKDVSLAFASMIPKMKEFDLVVFRTLEYLYEEYRQTEVLQGICSMLIKSEKYQTKYFKWYQRGVKEQLKLTQLYESYLYAYDESRNEELPESLLIYFGYHSSLADVKKAFLFAYIIKNKNKLQETYLGYRNQMTNFMLKQLKLHLISENLKVIYEDLLLEDLIDEEIAKDLPYIMFRHDVVCYNKNYSGVVAVHKVLSIEQHAPLVDGRAQINIFADGTEVFLVDRHQNRYVKNRFFTVKKLFNFEPLVEKTFELNSLDGMLIIYMGDRIDNFVREDYKGMKVRKKLIEVPHLKEEYKKKCLYDLIRYTFDNGENDLLDYYLDIIDLKDMFPKDRSYVIEYLILRGFREKALEAITQYGYRSIPVKRLFKLATKSIEAFDNGYSKIVLDISEFTFRSGKYNEQILGYLIRHFNGGISDMYEIWKTAYDFQVQTTPMEERLLAQMLFSESYVPDVVEVFRSYYRNYNNLKVVKAFLMYHAYKYLVRGRVFGEYLFEVLKKESSYHSNDLYTMALLKYYSDKEDLNTKETYFVYEGINMFSNKGMILPFFKKFGNRIQLPEYIMDKHYVEYITDPGTMVTIHYGISDGSKENDFEEEVMKDVYLGIRVKEFILFFGDDLQYYIEENVNGTKNITESFDIKVHECLGEEETRYNKINLMIMTRSVNDEKTLLDTMKSQTIMDYVAENIFEPL